MSKEYLEAFKRLNEDDSDYALKQATKDIEIVENALQRLEAIDNAKPSEVLEILDDLKNGLVNKETGMIMFNQVWFKNQIYTIKQYFLKAQGQEKALKIIFEKYVDLNLLDCDDEVEEYNRHFGKDRQLTHQEFALLKRRIDRYENI